MSAVLPTHLEAEQIAKQGGPRRPYYVKRQATVDGVQAALLALVVDSEVKVAMGSRVGLKLPRPAHPGSFVKSEILEAYSLSVTDAARVLGITRAALSAFINQHSALSPGMALRLEKAFGLSMEMLMRMQNSFDIVQARKRAKDIKVQRFAGRSDVGVRMVQGNLADERR